MMVKGRLGQRVPFPAFARVGVALCLRRVTRHLGGIESCDVAVTSCLDGDDLRWPGVSCFGVYRGESTNNTNVAVELPPRDALASRRRCRCRRHSDCFRAAAHCRPHRSEAHRRGAWLANPCQHRRRRHHPAHVARERHPPLLQDPQPRRRQEPSVRRRSGSAALVDWRYPARM